MTTVAFRRAALLAACLFPFALPAVAQDACALPYETYEIAVPHTDLETCPSAIDAPEGSYCRVSVVAEVATIFVFAEADDCLVSTQALYEEEFALTFE
ncbi:hypothetical protein [Jannaschia aquimarina]|uniref:Uncharacterized protein n=1 Tax=Jannaschia aquimarina TaxID=935700 RepID=A0A0D1DBS4_9RHOB|nr:hypothetical protein [Jannaschia aquimarina]KIT17438.1 hypothetical protein jaqu_06260 [Jannaschia aquimarina]SNS76091.1 hypothetical protein SAMN05421775_102184 [Jannaschia aquimarina]